MYGKDIEKVLITEDEIRARLKEVAKQISNDYKGKDLLVVCVLRGAFIFFADLVRELTCDPEVDFIAVSSYGTGASTSGEVKMVKDINSPISNRHVLILEDIIDTGMTLNYLKELLYARQPASLRVCALLDKPERRLVDLVPEYKLFSIPNEFVVGYGLDYAERYRNLKDVCVLARHVYEK